LLTEAAGTLKYTNPHHHIQLLARATLLLRIATGVCAALLDRTGTQPTDLRFWSDSIGEERGFWEPGNAPQQLADLWQDIELAIQDLSDWQHETTALSWARLRRELPSSLSALTECERIGLWGIGL